MDGADAVATDRTAVFARPVRIVCAYADESLTGEWFRVYQRLRRMAARAGLDGRVELTPLSALPPAADVLLVPPGLAGAAGSATAHRELLAVTRSDAGAALNALFARLEHQGLLARRLPPPAGETALPVGQVVRHHGFRRVQ